MPFMRYEKGTIVVGEFESVLTCMDFTSNGYIKAPLFGNRKQIKVKVFKKSEQVKADAYMEQLHMENALEESYKAKWFERGTPAMVKRNRLGTA